MSKLKSYIYQVTNKINGKLYIGKTIDFKNRKTAHLQGADRGDSGLFYNAIRKYGPENFKWKILFQDYCHPNKLNELEKFFIAYYETTDRLKGYNIHIGGLGGDTLTYHPNREEIKIKISKTSIKNGSHKGKRNLSDGVRLLRNKRISDTLNKINPKTGLTTAQEIGKKTSKTLKTCNGDWVTRGWKTRRLNGSVPNFNGSKNPMAKERIFIKPTGEKIISRGDFTKICVENNLPIPFIRNNINKGKISSSICTGKLQKNSIGWEIIESPNNYFATSK